MATSGTLSDPGLGTTHRIELIPVLSDNYVIVLHDGREAAVVDPAVGEPVAHWLQEHDLNLVAVLQTHHHSDHIGGTPFLLRRWPGASVVASREDRQRIPFQTIGVSGGDRLDLLGRPVEVIEVPGHTRAHLAYFLPAPEDEGAPGWNPAGAGELFCGDTLFAAGCGRLFEGSPAQMEGSLQHLAALPEETRVWCAHEYTEANLRWASRQAPDDDAITARLREVRDTRRQGRPTIPSTIAQEKATNLFLRTQDAEAFAALRQSKDHWRP